MDEKIKNAIYFNKLIEDKFNPAETRGLLYGALMVLYDDDTEKVKEHLISTKMRSLFYKIH